MNKQTRRFVLGLIYVAIAYNGLTKQGEIENPTWINDIFVIIALIIGVYGIRKTIDSTK